MNVVDLIEDARPEVAPMPLAERRMVRERLFGAADDVVRTTIRERSTSGAVTATAPSGYRARSVSATPRRPRRTGSLAKVGAGLLVLGVAAAAGWSWYNDASGDDTPSLASEATTTTSSTSTTVAPTTTLEPTRTGISPDAPVVFPLGLIPVEEAVVDVAATDDEFALLRAGDGTWLRLEVVEGAIPDYGGLEFVSVGSVEVAPFAFGPGAPWIYVFRATCGAVRLIDAAEQERLRPVMEELIEGFSIDAGGAVDALLPPGVRLLEAGAGREEYRTVFRFEPAAGEGGEAEFVTLRQVPGGSLAQLVPAGAQPSEMVWLGEPAVGTGDLDPGDGQNGSVAVYWRDGDTVLAVETDSVPLDRLEEFVSGLRAASVDDWIERFSARRVDSTVVLGTQPDDGDQSSDATDGEQDAAPAAPSCAPQPSLGPTFLP